jgi:endonuclease/exonuclease/phosphatase family metal-dependent hydrolase
MAESRGGACGPTWRCGGRSCTSSRRTWASTGASGGARPRALAACNEVPTFPASFPLLRLDRCYVDGAFAVRSVDVVRTPLARRASDHLPLVVELELLPVARRPPAPRLVEAAGVTTRVGGRPAG